MRIVGIDVGKRGGFCKINKNKILDKKIMPLNTDKSLDIFNINDYLKKNRRCLFIIEKINASFSFHRVSNTNFSLGVQYGSITTLMKILNIKFIEIPAKTWQKEIFSDLKKRNINTKVKASIKVKEIFPNENFVMSERSYNEHDGIIDAALIAHYGDKYLKK
jgi:hypothetical protein